MENEKIFYDSIKFPFRINGTLKPDANTQRHKISFLHFHEEYELVYCSNGVFECVIDSVCYKLFEGDIVFINSNIPHETSVQDNTSTVLLQFKAPYNAHDSLRYLRKFLIVADNPFYIFRNGQPETNEIEKCILNIFFEYQKQNNAFEYYTSANIHMILAILYRYNIISTETIPLDYINISKILPILEYIEKNFNNQITISEAAAVLNINKDYFCRLFKKCSNCTFTEYLNFVRVCKAEHMLKRGLSISDTAYNTGFASQSYFNKLFKKYKLCSPSEYKYIIKHQPHNL